jgi:hypothetical protein
VVEGGLVAFDDEQVGALLDDQPVGVLSLGVERIGGDHGVGEVQAAQQWPELGDLVGLAVNPGLAQDAAAGMVHDRQQVHLCGVVVAAAAQGLAVNRDRPARRAGGRRRPGGRWGWQLGGQPGADGTVEASGSTRASTRRTVASPGGLKAPVHGSRRTPSAARTWQGASLAHSPMAARDLAPTSECPAGTPVVGIGDLGEVAE